MNAVILAALVATSSGPVMKGHKTWGEQYEEARIRRVALYAAGAIVTGAIIGVAVLVSVDGAITPRPRGSSSK